MSLFAEPNTALPEEPVAPRSRLPRGIVAGIWALVVALLALLGMSFLPSPFVIERPGPVFNTIGTVENADGEEVPLLTLEGAETYPTAGTLDLLTVQVVGTPERRLSWLDVAFAWFDGSKAVVPIEQIYPTGQTSEQRTEENATLMVDSQADATAAALTYLDYDIASQVQVQTVQEDGAADGILEVGDVIVAVDGADASDADAVRTAINAGEGAAVQIEIERDGTEQTVEVTPQEGTGQSAGLWLVGVGLVVTYDLPVQATVELENVGGPSAGMMFSLAMIDMLTPGELNGGADVAGTGTITQDGTVGAIGGIRQKMWGAEGAGADYFLAPASNCNEVVGSVPDGLQVFSVETLDDAVTVLDAIAAGDDLASLPTCSVG